MVLSFVFKLKIKANFGKRNYLKPDNCQVCKMLGDVFCHELVLFLSFRRMRNLRK
ncbi:hypothetical protein RC62_4176 [Flavobacterium aquidurense]|uniref:Uncharacterized protein n=1 Tax=Flavobacterium aquidurense TaxID=362413 RepID=A0A0Q0XWJ5_9FLAO|nr:hypothetical protein RC62_4176 [Flavobacterium aquidurense]